MIDFDLDGIQMDADGEYKYKIFVQSITDLNATSKQMQGELETVMRVMLNCPKVKRDPN